ncbi:hypothetical protein CC1G_04875 [Coprinopsis cinerea okayama7|uniref:Hydrophobin n=1 Tax=Coprinopsis cinerea (strain Okayama-7 / 130 / ATCC MYA-4618 / FGSC 9003) TaxID=240176 RepID=A8PFW4_COPC7|nr:hypothetical protein CC1G_04875 [Coprinopsis cinerea okayama7\|eukprot:XP_001841031.2 hypothetical protein CC1G_04875 [Coprinopsis cinerea okayama7\
MFARASTLLTAALLASTALAAPSAVYDYSQCNGGEIQCCNKAQSTKALEWTTTRLIGLLGLDLKGITGLVGTECTAINVAGVGGGSSCTQQKVCCTNNSFSE